MNLEDFHGELRQLIAEIYSENIKDFLYFLTDYKILNKKEPETEEEKMELLREYGENIKNDKFFAGNLKYL